MKLRKGFVQGIEALMLAMLCHWTNADGAAPKAGTAVTKGGTVKVTLK